ncbi:hypothetical protein B484DRAFT_396812 [Ochromonadaceae sp. CCMP2298]|nr:hypothetical protein B484DRAFT_396812 [Ochromonadaceae sp. CCMP2298]
MQLNMDRIAASICNNNPEYEKLQALVAYGVEGESVKGRPTADPKTMNGDETKVLGDKVAHPTIDHIRTMINGLFAYRLQRGKTGKDMKLWKVAALGSPMVFDMVTRAQCWKLDTLLRGKGDATMLLTIRESFFVRALYGFVKAKEFEHMELRQVQRLASWGRRYGTVNKMLLPFTTALDNATRGW